jgi:crotonobetainyl-CoA:carnitine CoA-transferase CaiB-like acyl-CoA transferase
MRGPLSHVRVLDLSRIMAGPWASQVLADLGADVIKVERPGAGDDTRTWGPPFLKDKDGQPTKESGYYLSVNRGKRSITVDLSLPRGQDVVRALAAKSDIVLENYKAGTLEKYGLAYDDLCKVNPGLIYASVTGFGQTGPRRDQAAYDFMIQAMGGLMSITGERDNMPGGGPQKVGVPIVDIMTGMYTAVAVLAALSRRAVTGKGDYIDVAMLDVQAAFLANQSMNYLISGKAPQRNGNKHPNIQPQDVFRCRDGYIALAVGNDGQFAKFCHALGRPELATDDRFIKNEARVRNLSVLLPQLQELFAGGDMARWVEVLDAAGVPCSPINTVPAALDDPQIRHREMVREIAHPLSGVVSQVVSPLKFRNEVLDFPRAPPLLGANTEEILRELGIEGDQLESLRAERVV